MREMFYGCSAFDQDISGWNVAAVDSRDGIFAMEISTDPLGYVETSRSLAAAKRPAFPPLPTAKIDEDSVDGNGETGHEVMMPLGKKDPFDPDNGEMAA